MPANSLESSVVLRIMEVIHSSYEAGHVQLTDFISFLVTLLSQYEVTPGNQCSIQISPKFGVGHTIFFG